MESILDGSHVSPAWKTVPARRLGLEESSMKIESLAMCLGFIGLCLPAHAGLIGSTVDLRELFPTPATMTSDDGSGVSLKSEKKD